MTDERLSLLCELRQTEREQRRYVQVAVLIAVAVVFLLLGELTASITLSSPQLAPVTPSPRPARLLVRPTPVTFLQ